MASLGTISWMGTVQDSSKVDLTMRSGTDEDPNLYWRRRFVVESELDLILEDVP